MSSGCAREYVELAVTSNFSFLRGGSHPSEFVEQAAELGATAVAITDRNSLAGVVRAHEAAKRVGVGLVVGVRLVLRPKEMCSDESQMTRDAFFGGSVLDVGVQNSIFDTHGPILDEIGVRPFSLFVYPTSKASYGRLSQLLTNGKLRAPKGQCLLSLEDVAVMSEGMLAVVLIEDWTEPGLERDLLRVLEIFGERASLALRRSYGPDEDRLLDKTVALGHRLGFPLVATNDVHYHCPERRCLQDVLTCIRLRTTLAEAGLSLLPNAERHLKPIEEMKRLFRGFPEAIERSVWIANQALAFSLDQLKYEYPEEICPTGKTPEQYLRELTEAGVQQRYPAGAPLKVAKQIEYELKLIRELDYEKYFLTVYHIVTFARSRNILCQGRGAAANSAVCYVLGVTAVDPSTIDLLVERFISKERNEPPDIDIDFEHERREEVIQYIYNTFGRRRAALVAEVVSYRTRSSIRDIGKTFGLELETLEAVIKLVSRSPDEGPPVPERFQHYGLDVRDWRIRSTIALASELQHFPRHLSQHVGGFIVSQGELSEIVPIENASMPDRTVIEWDKDDVDALGMLKIDVLGLGMLTAIRKCFELVNDLPSRRNSAPLELHTVPAEDRDVYQMVSRADTIGVFQIESRAQMSMLPRLRPRCFYDLVIEVAIVRPGPIQGGMVHPYLRRRCGDEPVTYPDERVKAVLQCTLGVPIFQEQVMQLAIVAGGFTPGQADELRRAMASWRRKKNKLYLYGQYLQEGMLKNGYTREFAETLFEQIKGFGEYGFPQSHAASFALLVYVSAWLKCHHPAAFAAALINSQPMGFYQPAQIISCAKAHGVEIRPLDVLESGWNCALEELVPGRPALRLGLRLVRGLRETDAEKLVACVKEQKKKFSSLVDLWRRSGVSVSSLKKLAAADAFNSLGFNRQQALWEMKRLRDERLPLLDSIREVRETVELPPLGKGNEVMRDYAETGLSLKAHPIWFLRSRLTARGCVTTYDLRDSRRHMAGSRVAIAGLVLVRQKPGTSTVVFITLEDETGIANVIVRPKIFDLYRDIAVDSRVLYAVGRLQREREIVHLIVDELDDLTDHLPGVVSKSRDFH